MSSVLLMVCNTLQLLLLFWSQNEQKHFDAREPKILYGSAIQFILSTPQLFFFPCRFCADH